MSKTQNRTILIVEDDRFLSSMYTEKLLLAGFGVCSAFDGEAGLRVAHERQPDAILLDIMLPGLDGFELLRRLRAEMRFAKTPIIILTNLSDSEQVKRGLAMGANDYLIKSHFVPSEVLACIQALVR